VSEPVGRVVVVEDRAAARNAVVAGLRQRGSRRVATPMPSMRTRCSGSHPDLAMLDVRLSSGTGFALARHLRDRRALSIIFLTARDAVGDRVEGLELGADEYVVKPFALEELLARIRAGLRRDPSFQASHDRGSGRTLAYVRVVPASTWEVSSMAPTRARIPVVRRRLPGPDRPASSRERRTCQMTW
jgi:DNA-binding response OmpR family regulator